MQPYARRRRWASGAVAGLLCLGATSAAAVPAALPTLPPSGAVPALDETQTFPSGSGDIADDPAIWIHPTDPSRSVVVGTNKATGGGLQVHDLAGNRIQYLNMGDAQNNVDVRGNLFVSSDRGDRQLEFLTITTSTRTLQRVGTVGVGFEPYGTCLYRAPDGTLYAFVTRVGGGDFDQYRLTVGTTVTAQKVRDLSTSTQSEACAADDVGGHVYLAEEDRGLYKYSASPTGGTSRTAVDTVGAGHLVADVEGVSIARDRTSSSGHLLVSSQGNSTFHVYDLAAPHTWRKQFTVAGSSAQGTDSVTGSDGIDVTRAALGPAFPQGLFVTHDTTNSGGQMSNFKLVDAGDVLGDY